MSAPDNIGNAAPKRAWPILDKIAISLWVVALLVVGSGIFALVSQDAAVMDDMNGQIASDG